MPDSEIKKMITPLLYGAIGGAILTIIIGFAWGGWVTGGTAQERIDEAVLPLAAENLKIPYVASGGIGNAMGLAAALSMGADGINMGTRFMVTQEAPIHQGIKQKVVEMDENQTRLIFRSYKNTARVYRNGVADQVADIEASGGDFGQVHHLVSGANQEKAWSTGDIEAGMVTVGMCGGLINDIPTCDELVKNVMSDAEQIIRDRFGAMLG